MATDSSLDGVTPDQLSGAERRLYELARVGMPLAEIAVRLGLPVSEVDRRIDLLVARLGLRERLALREPLREPEPVTVDQPEPGAQEPGSPHARTLSRRKMLAGAGGAALLVAAGGAGAFALRRNDDRGPYSPEPPATPAGEPPVTAAAAPAAGLDLIEPVNGAFERRTFAPGEEVPWPHGIFFMDVDTAQIDGWRIIPPYADSHVPLIAIYSLPTPRFVEAGAEGRLRILLDRDTRESWVYPAGLLQLVTGTPGTLVFEELTGTEQNPGIRTGRYHITGEDLKPRARFESPAIKFGALPIISPNGMRIATVTATGEQFAVELFDLQTGLKLRSLALPLATTATVAVGWHEELTQAPHFAVEFRLAADPDFGVRTLRVGLPWDGEWPDKVPEGLDHPRSVFYSPDGAVQLRPVSLRTIQATAIGGGEDWPAVEMSLADDVDRRIRSASLFYGDAIPGRRWTADGSWFFTLTATNATEGPGWERLGYTAWQPGAGRGVPIELPPPTGSRWFHSTRNRGPIPHPTDPSLVALGRFEVARFQVRPGASFVRVLHANVTSESGPDHRDPWSGHPNELVFALAHGGHGGSSPGAMITPLVEESPPFDDSMRFVVARAGDCVNLREGPSLSSSVRTCLVDGTPLEIWANARGSGLEENVAFVRNEDGAWVGVRMSDGTTGWISSAYLDWQ